MSTLTSILTSYQPFHPILPRYLQHGHALLLDMNATHWHNIDIDSPEALQAQTLYLMQHQGADIAIGQYGEDRAHIYQRSELFQTVTELRSIHLGIDLMVHASTPIYAPLAGYIHSYADHQQYGDYGPTIILAHELAGYRFYTLYAHLSRSSLDHWSISQPIQPGQYLADVGTINENGQWPCHIHFQIIEDLMGYQTGYPGVACPSEADYYLANCPNPNLILGINALTSLSNA